LVPVGVLAGLGALSGLVFTLFGLLFDAENARQVSERNAPRSGGDL
jgi:hypothetical protein